MAAPPVAVAAAHQPLEDAAVVTVLPRQLSTPTRAEEEETPCLADLVVAVAVAVDVVGPVVKADEEAVAVAARKCRRNTGVGSATKA